MEIKPMKILIIEDDMNDCNAFIECVKNRKDIEIVPDNDYGDLTEEEKEKCKAVKIDHITFVKKESKAIHYNFAA